VDFSGSIRGPERASYRLELEREILPALRPGDRIIIAPIHDRTLTGFRALAEATLPEPPRFNGWFDNRLEYNRRLRSTEKELVDLAAKQRLADLTGVCVYVSGASAATAQLVAEIARFWDTYFRRARADFDPSRYAPMLLHWPPSRGCAANQFFKP